jgi:hypothetical protein
MQISQQSKHKLITAIKHILPYMIRKCNKNSSLAIEVYKTQIKSTYSIRFWAKKRSRSPIKFRNLFSNQA